MTNLYQKIIFLFITLLSVSLVYGQAGYKQLMNDMQVNFYDVVVEAERHFETHDKGKGSGWKGYQRWKAENESKYYPTGNRSKVDPYFTENAYKQFIKNNPIHKTTNTGSWIDLGPFDANNITSHYSPGIGRVECFWVNPSDSLQIYMGSRSGGFWKTNNEGSTWQNTTDFLIASGVNTMTVNPFNSDIFINVQNAGNSNTHGIYKSTDGGDNWTLTAFNPTNLGWGGLGSNAKIYKIVFHPTIPYMIFIGTSKGIFRSSDNLQTWTQSFPTADITDIEFHPTNPNIIYVYDDDYYSSYANNIGISTDLGLTYSISNTISGNSGSKGHIAVSPLAPNNVFFASSNGVWKSTNSGLDFTLLLNPDESCHGFAVSDLDTLSMIYGYVDIEISTNGGSIFDQATWWANSAPDDTYVHADLRTAECVNGVYYVGTDGYLAKSNDNGYTWTRLNDGTGIKEFYAVGLSQSNYNVNMAGSQDNGTSILDSTGWIEWNGGDGMEAIVLPLNEEWMIGSWQYGSRQRTQDGGQTRHGISTPQSGSSQADWQAPLLFNPNHQRKVYHFSDSVFVSDKFGDGWEYVGAPAIDKIKVATIAENNSGIMIVSRNDDILLSLDTGATYTSIATGLPGHSIKDICFDPNDDNTIVVVYNRYQDDGQKVYISHNMGTTWTNITYNLEDMPIRSVVIDHTDNSNIYLGAEIGVFYMSMDSTSWSLYNPGLANTTIRDLEIQYGSNTLRAATWGRGLWEYPLVDREDYPKIITSHITNPPTNSEPLSTVDQFITSVISYNGTLSNVYLKWSANSSSLNNVIQMNNTQDSTWVSITSIPNFNLATDIYFQVFAVGSNNDTTETYRFMYTTKHFTYCESYGNMSWATAVTLVDFNGIYNSTQKTQPYTNYSATDSSVVQIGNTYNLSINLNTDGNYTCHSKVWIDWNIDGDFEDSNEEYDLGFSQNTSDGITDLSPLSITVPANAFIGKTTMRVAGKYGSDPVLCQTDFDGEVEDYAIIITCIPTTNNLVVNSCGEYTSPSGNYIYSMNGIYNDTIQSLNGCDSILTIDLSITNIDVSLTFNQGTLTSNTSNALYQWINCSDNSVISGETNQSFSPISSGNYAAIISLNNCIDTTDCYNVILVGINENSNKNDFHIYPNPNDGEFTIDFGGFYPEAIIEITDMSGKIIFSKKETNSYQSIINSKFSPGEYIVLVRTRQNKSVLRLLIK